MMEENNQTYFIGELVNNSDEQKFHQEELKRKRRHYIVTNIPKKEKENYINKNFKLIQEYKYYCWFKKNKDISELFEDEIWLLFKKMGFSELNKGSKFKINITPDNRSNIKTKQIDVFARYEDVIFIIECKASKNKKPKSFRKDIAEIKDNKVCIENSIKEYYGKRKKIIYLFCTRNCEWSENDIADAKGADILIWTDSTISYFKKLSQHISSAAKYQLFSFILRDQKIEDIPAIPAIKGVMGEKTYYLFMIQPGKLLRISYVHHRSPIHLGYMEKIEEGNAYQRMINKSRRENIDKFISKEGFFANNVIINFNKEPKFVDSNKLENIETGFLKLPSYPASAWIIDGQHRLYGYADNPKKDTDMIPVLAFYDMSTEDEGKLFVTINKEQKSVEPNLLWDLYGDIYDQSEDDIKKYLCTVSKIIKNLNKRTKSPFYDNIYIPSFNERENRLTIVTFANALNKSYHGKTIIKKNGLLFRINWETTETFATNRIELFFDIIKRFNPKDWDRGEKGFICSNNGIAVLIRIFPEFISYINYRYPGMIDKSNLSDLKNHLEKLMSPFIEYLRGLDDNQIDGLRKITSNEEYRKQISDDLLSKVKRQYNDFAPHLPPGEEERGKKLVKETEIHIRNLIKEKLKEKYQDKWWKQGATNGAKEYVNKRIKEGITSAPWKEEDIKTNIDLRIELITIGHYKDIIIYKNNWELFEPIFKSIKEVELNFEGFAAYRNSLDHIREEPDEIVKRRNFLCMNWIRKCLNLD